MGDPGSSVEPVGSDEADDAGEVGWEGVAGAEEGAFGAVKGGVPQADFLAGEADVDQAAAVGDEAEGGGHGLWIAGRVDDDVGQVAAADFAKLVFELVGWLQSVLDVHLPAA